MDRLQCPISYSPATDTHIIAPGATDPDNPNPSPLDSAYRPAPKRDLQTETGFHLFILSPHLTFSFTFDLLDNNFSSTRWICDRTLDRHQRSCFLISLLVRATMAPASTAVRSMASLVSLLLAVSMVAAQSAEVLPSNATLPTSESASEIVLSFTGGPIPTTQTYNLAPLTDAAGKGQSATAVAV